MPVHDVLEDLVQCMSHVQVAVCVGRPVMQRVHFLPSEGVGGIGLHTLPGAIKLGAGTMAGRHGPAETSGRTIVPYVYPKHPPIRATHPRVVPRQLLVHPLLLPERLDLGLPHHRVGTHIKAGGGQVDRTAVQACRWCTS